jgi:hypothetical protein
LTVAAPPNSPGRNSTLLRAAAWSMVRSSPSMSIRRTRGAAKAAASRSISACRRASDERMANSVGR